MTVPASITFSSSSSLHLGPSYHLPAASTVRDVSISHSIIHGSTMPAQGMSDIAHITLQSQTEIEQTSKRIKRSRQVRFDSKISGRRIVSYTDEVRRDIYYNVSHLGDIPHKLMCWGACRPFDINHRRHLIVVSWAHLFCFYLSFMPPTATRTGQVEQKPHNRCSTAPSK